jgi:hypothetical protein
VEEAEIEVERLVLVFGTKATVQPAHRKVRGYPALCPFWLQVLLSWVWRSQAVRGNRARKGHFLMQAQAQALEQGQEPK